MLSVGHDRGQGKELRDKRHEFSVGHDHDRGQEKEER